MIDWKDFGREAKKLIFPVCLLLLFTIFAKILGTFIPKLIVIETPQEQPITAVSSVEIVRGDTTKRQIIFTFDGGAEDTSASQILDVLKAHGIHSTFFLTGQFIEKYPEVVRRMSSEGHEIFNHTFTHPHLTEVSDEQIRAELGKTDDALQKITGISNRPYFRPPYGDRNERVKKAAAEFGYQSVYWTYDAMDWRETEGETNDSVKARVLRTAAPGNIYLMHLGDNIMGAILDDLIITLQSNNYKIVSLTQGLNPTQVQSPASTTEKLPL